MSKKVWGKQGVFGSTERRFVDPNKGENPGPAHYEGSAKKIGSLNLAKSKSHSVFSSTVRRGEKLGTENPPPGAYNLPSELGKKKKYTGTGNPLMSGLGDSRHRDIGFNAKVGRFAV